MTQYVTLVTRSQQHSHASDGTASKRLPLPCFTSALRPLSRTGRTQQAHGEHCGRCFEDHMQIRQDQAGCT